MALVDKMTRMRPLTASSQPTVAAIGISFGSVVLAPDESVDLCAFRNGA
jgi:hypothetical protein